ncbi:MAG: hypothetical protein JSU08_12320 [Acidobacteria bacterium]|nr:hypothetical protein [Acidobacteriota bacterium]
MSRLSIAALLALALSTAACNNNTTTSPTSTPSSTTVTDTFNGTLTRNGAANFAFNVSAAGAVYATLTSVSDPSVPVTMSLGIWTAASSVCSVVITNDSALQGAILAGSASGIGQLCVRVSDPVGAIANPVDYQITVVHY